MRGRFILPADAEVVPVATLPAHTRERLPRPPDAATEPFALRRPGLRSRARLIDAHAAELLGELRTPRTISEAVIRFSKARGEDPEAVLEAAFPLLHSLVEAGFLVPEGEEGALLPTLEPGDDVAGIAVRGLLQSLADTELYGAWGPAGAVALKLERRPGVAAERLRWEAAVLAHLGGVGAPRLVAAGRFEERFFLALEWKPGVDAGTAATELRRRGDRRGLLALDRAIAAAYAHLHSQGVVHGDVHQRNVLVAATGEVCLIDYDRAQWASAPSGSRAPGWGGVELFLAPESAAAALDGGLTPPDTPAAEQYSVAVLLDHLACGAYYCDFSLEKERMLRQIVEQPALAFERRGAEPWPELEAVLGRALAKAPAERFPSLAALAAALEGVAAPPPPPRRPVPGPAALALLERVLARLAADGPPTLPKPPRASIHYGGAGIAGALCRIAQAREDAEVLAAADLWAARSRVEAHGDEAFYDPAVGATPEIVGEAALYHSIAGVHLATALVARARGDESERRKAVEAFVAAARRPCPSLDLTVGRAGLLLGAALLLEQRRGSAEAPPLRSLGESLLAGLWPQLDAGAEIAVCDAWSNLGMAHGWAGFLYATLRWCRAAQSPRPAGLADRLAQLAACAQPWGRGLRWRRRDEPRTAESGMTASWCNGTAGMVYLWTLAERETGDATYARLAEGAAWNAWESPGRYADLCCGRTGRAYALLELYRRGGDRVWLARASELAELATQDPGWAGEHPDSLFKGEVGLAALAADLAKPEDAALPFFGEEGW